MAAERDNEFTQAQRHMREDSAAPVVNYLPPKRTQNNEERLRWCVFMSNLFFLFWSLAIIAIGLWMVFGRSVEISGMMGTHLYKVLAGGVFLIGLCCLIITFLGCCGAYREIRCMMVTFFIIIVLVIILLVVAIIFAIIFRIQLEGAFRKTMEDSLKERYGYDMHNRPENQFITDGWDKLQQRLNCCAVEDQGWGLYRETLWFKNQSTDQKLREFERVYVPESCCVSEWDTRRILNKAACQNMGSAPPNVKNGPKNYYLWYDGCLSKGKEFLSGHVITIIAVGIIVIVVLIVGAILSFLLCRKWER